jgi:uncharacterized protein (DUF433 family)
VSSPRESNEDDGGRIVATDDVLGGHPRIAGTRLGVLFVFERVVGCGLAPQTVAERHDLDVADVYRALAYYDEHPREMTAVRRERAEAMKTFEQRIDDPEDVRS